MTAVSPYAPPGRNSLLIHHASPTGSRASVGTTLVFLIALAYGFWRRQRQQHPNFLHERVSLWIKRVFVQDNSRNKSSCSNGSDSRIDSHDENANGTLPKLLAADMSDAVTIRENHRLIQSVLKYWFGQYTPDQSQKKLWMITDQATAHRCKVDAEIAQQYGHLLIHLATTDLWNTWCEDEVYGYMGKVAAIIVLDQFSRHVQRYVREHNATAWMDLPDQNVIDQRALQTAQAFVNEHQQEIDAGMIPVPMYIFALMPFRHASTIKSVQYVQQQVEQTDSLIQQYDAMLKRFRKATNRRMAVLQDEARRTGDVNKTDYTDEDILECFPFQADMSTAPNHPVYQTIRSFLVDRGVEPRNSTGTEYPIIISLSGGVDSMVIAAVLSHLAQHTFPLKIIAVHIDYANRPESAAEASYVHRYCNVLGITYKCRRIDEVTRGVTARDEYERIARQVRFSFYRATVEETQQQQLQQENATQVGIVLGHHRGDLRENVLSNAHKGCGPLDLSGMTAVSRNDGVTLYRPLLPLEKNHVYDYAHTFGVPYFEDTTPHWSTRGKLRNKLLPLLEEIYGEGSMKNLSNLAVESDECRALLHSVSLGPFLDGIAYKPMGITFETAPWKRQGLFFWKFVLREALHSAGLGMFSDKSVLSFLERVQATNLKQGWLQCRKDYAVFLRGDGKMYIFYPHSFPWRKMDMYNCEGRMLEFGRENAAHIGPWRVTAHLLRQLHSVLQPSEKKERLEIKAIPSMDDLMEGSFEYYIEVPTWEQKHDNGESAFEPRPLVFKKYTKATRPIAWKNTESKVEDILPVVGVDDIAFTALKDPLNSGACHLNADGDSNENPVLLAKITLRLASEYPVSSP